MRGHLESQHEETGGDRKPRKKRKKQDTETETEAEESEESEEEGGEWEEKMESEREERMEGFVRQFKRRKEVDRKREKDTPWVCDVGKCRKRYQSVSSTFFVVSACCDLFHSMTQATALTSHQSAKHTLQSTSAPSAPSLEVAPLINLALPPLPLPKPRPRPVPTNPNPSPAASTLLDLLTGHNYSPTASTSDNTRKFLCPFPGLLYDERFVEDVEVDEKHNQGDDDDCEWRFGRIYDVKRHLKSTHGIEVEAKTLESWYQGFEDDEGVR